MKNTLLPLSVAFVADDGTIVNIDDMKPQTLDSHCSTKPVRYVLEMNQGWFAKRASRPGAKLRARRSAAEPKGTLERPAVQLPPGDQPKLCSAKSQFTS